MDWLHWLEDDNILWNKTSLDLHDIAEILLKVALSTKNQINQSLFYFMRMQQIENKQ
jgi:hypothetical protein